MEAQLRAFLDSLRTEHNYSNNTIAAYRNDLGQFLRFVTAQPNLKSWSDITAAVVASYLDEMNRKSYAASSVARKVAALKSFFHFLFARSIINSDPTTDVESPKVEKRLPTTLDADDIERLLAAPTKKKTPKGLRDHALLNLLYATGMRVTELVSLQLSDLNLDQSMLICAGKDDEAARELPFDDDTEAILRAYLDNGRPHLLKDKTETALFLNHRGQRLTRQGLWLIIKTYAKQVRLGVSVTPHTLRHSFAAHKLQAGSNLQEIQQWLGHANISTTQIYTQVNEDAEETAASENNNKEKVAEQTS